MKYYMHHIFLKKYYTYHDEVLHVPCVKDDVKKLYVYKKLHLPREIMHHTYYLYYVFE